MCGKNFTFWCYTFLLLVSSSLSKPQKNYTSNEGKDNNLIEQYLNANSTINYGDKVKILHDLCKKSNNNTQNKHHINSTGNSREDNDSVQYELETHSTKNHENINNLMKLHANSTKVNNSKKNFTSQELYRDLMKIDDSKNSTSYEFYEASNKGDNKYNIVSYEMCGNITCIQLCCPLDDRLIDDKCISTENKTLTPFFPSVYKHINDLLQNESKRVNKIFHLVVHNPCQKSQHYLLDSNLRDHSEYIFFTNGSLYFPHNHKFVKSTSYCLAVMQQDKFDVIICSAVNNQKKVKTHNKINLPKKKEKPLFKSLCILTSLQIVSTLVLLITFIVYSTLPELRNTQGLMLCIFSGLTIARNILFITTNLINVTSSSICITIALTKYFCYLASYFWLTVMSFDIWWTFKKPLQRNSKEGKKKKFIIYFIYAWGFPCILTIICGIINFIPGVPKNQFQPIVSSCWIRAGIVFLLYYYVPKSICIISSVCLSISAALKIRYYEKDATHYLKNLESQSYKENKKWFNLYLKLFIVMFIIIGIKWCIAIGYHLYTEHQYNEYLKIIKKYIMQVINILINLSIFIIFVCKKRIMRLLLKRFGCQKCTMLSKIQYDADATYSSTCITMSGDISMPEKIYPCKKTNFQNTHSDATEL